MLGKARVMTPEGVRELAFYVDNMDLAADWLSGVIVLDEEIIYRDAICVVVDDFTNEDGILYTELLVVGSGAIFMPMAGAGGAGPGGGFQHVEFTMG